MGFLAGQEILAADLNEYTTDTYARYKASVAQSVAAGSWQPVTIEDVVDTCPHVTQLTTQKWRIETAGIWIVSAGIRYVSNSAGDRHIAISDTTSDAQRWASASSAAVAQNHSEAAATNRFFPALQEIGVWTWQNSGAALDTNPLGESVHLSFTLIAES